MFFSKSAWVMIVRMDMAHMIKIKVLAHGLLQPELRHRHGSALGKKMRTAANRELHALLPFPCGGRTEWRSIHSGTMQRSAVLLVVLFAMFWQTVGIARAGSPVNALADKEHTALHWLEEGHHHHEDGSYHADDSKESVQHMLCDHGCATAALLVSASHDFPPLGSANPGGPRTAPVSDPDPEGLLRPPRSRA